MTTPIIMLVLLMGPWLIWRVWTTARNRPFDGKTAAAIGLGVLFIFTGIGHFVKTASMATMFPDFVPNKMLLVQLSGILEFLIAITLFRPCYRELSAKIAFILLILLFPLNVYAAIIHTPMGGHALGPVYLLIRGPLQIAILAWTYFLILRKAT